jgi:hypothetical protein
LPAGRFGIRAGVKEHLISFATALDPSDRAALQSLVPLAGAVGAGTIFSLFAGTRRGTGMKVFEVFAIVAVLTAAALTAALAIDQLHANEAISSRDLTQIAMPLVIATLLLVVVSVYDRFSGSWERVLVLLPFVVVAVYVALLMLSSWSVNPSAAIWLVAAIFAIGLVLAGAGWAADRYSQRSGRSEQQARTRRLVKLGYVPTAITLEPVLPPLGAERLDLTGWVRGDVSLLGYQEAERLRDLVRSRWEALAAGEAAGPVGDSILLDIQLEHWVRNLRGSARMRFMLLRPRDKQQERTVEVAANADDLYDVSALVG